VYDDISQFVGGSIKASDEDKNRLIKERTPSDSFLFPTKTYNDKRRKAGTTQRRCMREWFQVFPFITYSKSQDGIYCLPCVLFPSPSAHGTPNLLVKQPYTNWKDAKEDLRVHSVCHYHKDAQAKMDEFVSTMNNPARRIDISMSSNAVDQTTKNRLFLISILKCIELCGRQGIALRGHRDDSTADDHANKGNFNALLQLRVDAGDRNLQQHLETAQRNATYISKTAQNDLLDCIRAFIQSKIVEEIHSQSVGPHYTIMADEVTDSSNWEQLGLVVRYTKNNKPVEKLFSFVSCESVSGASLCDKIVQSLSTAGLHVTDCRAQCFDGAGNMAGVRNGCAANFQKVAERAPYFHCASHDLNLVLCKSCKQQEIHRLLETLLQLGLFFRNSPKRQRQLEHHLKESTKSKIKPLCETRWVEKHKCIDDFLAMYTEIFDCLETISVQPEWDAKTQTDAGALLFQITSSSFLCALLSVHHLFGYTKSLCVLLQGAETDIIAAYEAVQLILSQLRDVRENAEKKFQSIFERVKVLAAYTGSAITIPRICKRQTMRNNIEADTPESYFRRSAFIPLFDNAIQQISERFPQLSLHATRGLLLLPANLKDLTSGNTQEVCL
jgi:hypothetical protein